MPLLPFRAHYPLRPSLLATYLSIVNSSLPPPLYVRLTLHTNAHTQISIYTHTRALLLARHLFVRSFGLGRICPHSQPPRCARQKCGYVETSPRRHVVHSVCHRPIPISGFRLPIRFPVFSWLGCEQTEREALGTGWTATKQECVCALHESVARSGNP